MTQADVDLRRAIVVIREYGCPICGVTGTLVFVEEFDKMTIDPCRHTVRSRDAFHMEQFYDELEAHDG